MNCIGVWEGMDEVERAIQVKTKMDLHVKAVSLGLTHFKDWKHTWRRFTVWQLSAKKSTQITGIFVFV